MNQVLKVPPACLQMTDPQKEVNVMDGQCILFNQHSTKINKNQGRGIKLQPN
jgi:hypothetical protein